MKWKHEEPLQDLESESESDSEMQLKSPFVPALVGHADRNNERESRRAAERTAKRELERQASGPYHQFVYQVSRERERPHTQWRSKDGDGVRVEDINNYAYDNVKDAWCWRHIWNPKWKDMPGMSWMHEVPPKIRWVHEKSFKMEEDSSKRKESPATTEEHEVLLDVLGRSNLCVGKGGYRYRNYLPVESNGYQKVYSIFSRVPMIPHDNGDFALVDVTDPGNIADYQDKE